MSQNYACAVHQPNLFPRSSTLAKLFSADVWVVLDDVQFNSRDYQHRARLAEPAEPARQRWLTLPVHRPHGRASRISELLLAETGKSRRRVEQLVRQYYGRSPFWTDTRECAEEVLAELELSDRLAPHAPLTPGPPAGPTRGCTGPADLTHFGSPGAAARAPSLFLRTSA